jgi:hypothetical protein
LLASQEGLSQFDIRLLVDLLKPWFASWWRLVGMLNEILKGTVNSLVWKQQSDISFRPCFSERPWKQFSARHETE